MRRIVVSSILALVIIGLVTAGYFFYRRYSGDVAEAIRAVPPDAAFIIECRSAKTTLFNLQHTDYWKNISKSPSMEHFKNRLFHIDSVFSADNDFLTVWKSNPIIISGHVTKADDFDWLFLFEVPRGTTEGSVTDMVKKIVSSDAPVTQHEYENVFIHELTAGGRTISFALHKGIFMCSYTSFLVEDAVRQLRNGSSLKSNKQFFTVYKTAGKNTDANVYFNYKSFGRFLDIYANSNASDFLELGTHLAEWSEADARFNASAILLNGYTAVKDTAGLAAVLKNQLPQEMNMGNILPARTAYFFHIGLSDPAAFFRHLQFSHYGAGAATVEMPKKSKLSVAENLTSWVGRELALVITESNTANYSNNTFACIEARDTATAMASLKQLCAAFEPSGNCKMENYNGHQIGLIKAEGLLPSVYGKVFGGLTKNYFTRVGHYVVFANQAAALRSFIDDAESGKALATVPAYKQMLANAEATSNVFVYVHLPHAYNILRSFSSLPMLKALDDAGSAVNAVRSEFSAMAMQYGNKSGMIYNHFVMQFAEESRKSVSLVWAAECDTSIHQKPQAVTDGANNYFMVQDDANTLYLFDVSGQQLWKKQMDEKIMSDIYSIDFFHNGTQQFLFNTASYLYLIDKNGAYMGNYPIRLPATASNGCVAIDFDNSKDYKIIVACTNRMLYAYETNGKAMNGWQYNKPAGTITYPVQRFKIKDKDYLVVATTDGKIELLDRRGALRVRVNEEIVISDGNIRALSTDSAAAARFVVADTAGNVFSIYTDGRVVKSIPGSLSTPVYFSTADINKDGEEDYVIFGSNTITVKGQDKQILFSHEFRETPEQILVCTGGNYVGSISQENNRLTIYNPDGTAYLGFPVKGSTPFIVTPLDSKNKDYIAIGSSDGSLYLYVME